MRANLPAHAATLAYTVKQDGLANTKVVLQAEQVALAHQGHVPRLQPPLDFNRRIQEWYRPQYTLSPTRSQTLLNHYLPIGTKSLGRKITPNQPMGIRTTALLSNRSIPARDFDRPFRHVRLP